jgi:hypothetical protein
MEVDARVKGVFGVAFFGFWLWQKPPKAPK